jgi:ABC-type antimicrobial peptide transport system permease subunit
VRAVAVPGVLLALAGVVVGGVCARLGASAMQSLIWGISPTDPATFGGVALSLLRIAAVASFLPSLRVARLNPAETLRNE